jgi:hypothetical protein
MALSLQELTASSGLPLTITADIVGQLAAKAKGDRVHRSVTHGVERLAFLPANVPSTSTGDDR